MSGEGESWELRASRGGGEGGREGMGPWNLSLKGEPGEGSRLLLWDQKRRKEGPVGPRSKVVSYKESNGEALMN